MADPRPILILCAMRMESRAVAAAFNMKVAAGCRFPAWTGGRYELRTIGISAVHLNAAWDGVTPAAVVMAGLAGGLDPKLAVGDVIIDDRSAPPPAGTFDARIGPIATESDLIGAVSAKQKLFARTGALAVEMENRIVRDAAIARGLPFLGLRAISDSAADGLDPAVVKLVDDLGRPKPLAVAAAIARRPALIPHLRSLEKKANLALGRLTGTLQQILNAGWPPA